MLSVTSFFTSPLDPVLRASKAAELSLTNGVRMELSRQGTLAVASAGFIDTDMAAGIDAPKISPESVAQQTFDAVEAGDIEVLTDERPKSIKASLVARSRTDLPATPAGVFWHPGRRLRLDNGSQRGVHDARKPSRERTALVGRRPWPHSRVRGGRR